MCVTPRVQPSMVGRLSTGLLLTILFLTVLLRANDSFGAELDIRITGVRAAEGQLMIQVLDSEAAFRDEAPAAAALILPARVPEVRFRTDALPPGSYGIRVVHDLNGDGSLNSNLLGMPNEPWAFSNDAVGRFGPPDWARVRFDLPADGAEMLIRLNH